MKWFLCIALSNLLGVGIYAAVAQSVSNASPEPKPVTGTFEIKPPSSSSPGVLRLPAPPVRRTVHDSQITAIKNKLSRYPTSAGYRRLAQRFIQLDLFPEAVSAHRAEAAIYRKKGLEDAALIVENKASEYETKLQIFERRAPTPGEMKKLYTGALLEPKTGLYVGAFIDRDDRLHRILRGTNHQVHRYPSEFARLVGKPHSTHFTYVAYGQPVPRRWLEMCKREKVIPHIAWEPKNLKEVKDDKYLQNWAKSLRALDWPVFIRFAGEMNGFWTPYHSNPILYRAKFRLVHRVLHRYAPRVATIWCVNSVPSQTIANYYPGDDGCDWVGVNFYNAPFYDNDPQRSALQGNPLSLLDPVYKRYAARKPIAICEYGASHQAAVDKKVRNAFAIEKMNSLYNALPRLYPRVKMINWFNSDNLKHAKPGRQLNNYSLTEQEPILTAYRSLISTPYFLDEIPGMFLPANRKDFDKTPTHSPTAYFLLRANQVIKSPWQIDIWFKTYVAQPKIFLALNGKIFYARQGAGVHTLTIPRPTINPTLVEKNQQSQIIKQSKTGITKSLQKVVLIAYIFDERNRFISSTQTPIFISRS